ncbi:uncharacterized protein [Struthio camelus]|uniref:uncharacterized protein isoform X2 n=1 Tax=Struthio camelus TaxID=8801 RepID=UPI003603E857
MGFAGSCWTLCSILLLLGGNLGVLIKAPQDSVNGTVGHSVLLPVSYKFTNSSCFPLSIQWTFSNRSDALITCTVLNCSLSAEGAPKHCFAKHFPHAAYRGRVVLFPENASLLLRDLQLSDGGVYSVTFKQQIQTRHITLTVYGHHFTSEDDNTLQDLKAITGYIVGGCLILFLLFFLLYCKWHFGAIFQKTSRVIKQQESSSHDESHMENKLRRDICTVYALIGDDQTQPRMM